MTATPVSDGTVRLIDVSGSQVGTQSNPFIVSSSAAPPIVNIINNNYVTMSSGGAPVDAGYVLRLSQSSLPGSVTHQLQTEAVHLIPDYGPRGNEWPPNLYKECGPIPFITSSIWWTDAFKTKKIVERLIVRNANMTPSTIQNIVYAVDGVTPVESYTDTIAYNGVFEISRTRTRP